MSGVNYNVIKYNSYSNLLSDINNGLAVNSNTINPSPASAQEYFFSVGNQLYIYFNGSLSPIGADSLALILLGQAGGAGGFSELAIGQTIANGVTPFSNTGSFYNTNGAGAAIITVGNNSNGNYLSDVSNAYLIVNSSKQIYGVDAWYSTTTAGDAGAVLAISKASVTGGTYTTDLLHLTFTDGANCFFGFSNTGLSYTFETNNNMSWSAPTPPSFHDGLVHKLSIRIVGNIIFGFVDGICIYMANDYAIGAIMAQGDNTYAFAQLYTSTIKLYGVAIYNQTYLPTANMIDAEVVTARSGNIEALTIGKWSSHQAGLVTGGNFAVFQEGASGAMYFYGAAGAVNAIFQSLGAGTPAYLKLVSYSGYELRFQMDNSAIGHISCGVNDGSQIDRILFPNGGGVAIAGRYIHSDYSFQIPTTGTTIAMLDVDRLVIAPASLLATLTIKLPASPAAGQEAKIICNGFGVTTLTLQDSAGGANVLGGPTTLTPSAPGNSVTCIFHSGTSKWYCAT